MDTSPIENVLLGPFGAVAAATWGALWGSFFNVVIVRVPQCQSVVSPGSFCQACGSPIRWYDNIPIVSYLLLRGKCRKCGNPFSARYAFVEALCSGLALACYITFVIASDAPFAVAVARFVIASLFCGVLIAIAVIDLDTMLIPNVITYPGIPVAIALSFFMGHDHWWDGPVGAITGYAVIRLIADGYQIVTGRMGMGYGDAKLLAMVGGLLGWSVLLPVLFLASMQGSIIGITALVIVRRRQRAQYPNGEGEPSAPDPAARGEIPSHASQEAVMPESDRLRYASIPFGPFLVLATLELLLFKEQLIQIFPVFG